jgi:hypothetical protein
MTEMTSVGNDFFGFEKAIQIDHLTDEQIETLENIFKDFQ